MALDRLVPRYALWLHMNDVGFEPEDLDGTSLLRFFDRHLETFLEGQHLHLAARPKSRLRAALVRYDPAQPTPYEFMERISASFS